MFSTFSVVLLVLGHPECLASSTDTRPTLKHECHLKTAVRLKECSPKASGSISRIYRLTKLHTKLDADILLNFAIHHRQNNT
jgi:hypothetical protein